MIDIERERKRFLDWWWTTNVGDPHKIDESIWLAAKEQASNEIAALREYAEQQCCECHDEWGNKKPHRCHRCRVLHLDAPRENPRQ